VDVNTSAFTVPPSFMGNNNQNAYTMSILDMSQRLSAIYTNGIVNTDYNINSLIKVRKVLFGPDNLRMLIIQPIYSPAVKKRCILISPGNGESFGNWYHSNRYAMDFALRGYMVAFYENSGSTNTNTNNSGQTTNDYFNSKVIGTCGYTTKKDNFLSTMFINLFISNEARKYVVNNSVALQIDTTRFFLAGGSLGANTALFFGYGSNNNWSSNAYYQCVKSKLNYSENISNNGVKGIMSMGGGLPAPTEALGNIITDADNIPSIWLGGAGDPLVNPNSSNILGPVIWGELAYKSVLQTYNIRHNMYLNCYGFHVFQTTSFNDQLWQTNANGMTLSASLNPVPTQPPFNYVLTQQQVNSYLSLINTTANQKRYNYYNYDQSQGFQGLNTTAQYFNNIINTTIQGDNLIYIKPTCLQNPYFLSYQNNTLNIDQAALCTSLPNVLCSLNTLSYLTTAEGCSNSTFVLYNQSNNSCPSVSNNLLGSSSFSSTKIDEYSAARIIDPSTEINLTEKGIVAWIDLNKQLIFKTNIEIKDGSIELFNYTGSKIAPTIYIGTIDIGEYNYPINIPNSLAPGIYICTISSENYSKSIKEFVK
jgi:hypothetical protein